MEERKTLFVFVLLVFALTACAPERDPRNIADAYATQAEADRLSVKNEYDLGQRAIVDTIENTEKQTRLDIFVAVKDDVTAAAKWSVILLTIVFIPAAGLYIWQTGKTMTVATERVVFAAASALEMRATLIMLDKKTRTFPVQLKEIDGKMYAINHNTGAKFLLSGDKDIPATPQMVAQFGQAVTAGLLAMEAAGSKGKAGEADKYGQINPTVISLAEMTGELVSMN